VIGIEELQDFVGLQAFPNPASDAVNLRIEGMDGLLQIRIYDLAGKSVLADRQVVQSGAVLTYSVASLGAGMYILEATSTTQRTTLQLSVE
jgi:hypothetical protein